MLQTIRSFESAWNGGTGLRCPTLNGLAEFEEPLAAQGGKDLEQQIRQKSRATSQLTIHFKAYSTILIRFAQYHLICQEMIQSSLDVPWIWRCNLCCLPL